MEGVARVSRTEVAAGRPVSRLAAVTLGGLAFAVMAAVVPLSILAHQNPLASAGTGLALGVPFAAVGVVVLRRQGNLIGWPSPSCSCSASTPGSTWSRGTGSGSTCRWPR
jgi:hypothetical protein